MNLQDFLGSGVSIKCRTCGSALEATPTGAACPNCKVGGISMSGNASIIVSEDGGLQIQTGLPTKTPDASKDAD